MIEEIKTLKNWEEASLWLARHGFGLEQIREQKELWDKINKKAAPRKPGV